MLAGPQDDEETGDFDPFDDDNPLDPISEFEEEDDEGLISIWDSMETELEDDYYENDFENFR